MPISITVEGANILTRNLIIFGQGVIRCHPYLRQEMAALSGGTVKEFDSVFGKHIRYTLSAFARVLFHSFTAGLFLPGIKGMKDAKIDGLNKYVRQLTRMSISLSFVSEIAIIILGGKLKRRERLSARLGDVLSNLYLASAVLKYYQDFGDRKTDLPYVKWAMNFCLCRTESALVNFMRNFHFFGLRHLLRFIVFPYGLPYCKPTDDMEHQLANSMLTPGAFRDRLLENCYLGTVENDEVALLEQCFLLMTEAEPLLAKMDQARKNAKFKTGNPEKDWPPPDFLAEIDMAVQQGILSDEEALLLRKFEKARRKVIQVDEFTEAQLRGRGQGRGQV